MPRFHYKANINQKNKILILIFLSNIYFQFVKQIYILNQVYIFFVNLYIQR